MKVECLAFVAFPVDDLERSRDFYANKIGAPVIAEGDDSIDFDLGGTAIRVYVHSGEYRRQHSGLQFAINNINKVFEELTLAGVRPRSGVRTEPWGGQVFTIADPDGNMFDLLDASYLRQQIGSYAPSPHN
jgi:catechol 2,3-dioxygenase-like lactoylglutathione lyase family enzyme